MLLVADFGCARTLPLSDWDRCGLQGMELVGVRMTDGRGDHFFVGRGMMMGSSYENGREVSCRLPPREDRERNCEVKAYSAKAVFKMNNKRRSDGALEEVAQASVAEWQHVYRDCMTSGG